MLGLELCVTYITVFSVNYNFLGNGVRDRAYIFVNQEPRGILSRQDAIWSIPLSNVQPEDILQILVENQGRIGYGHGNVDFKGKHI